MGDKDLYEPLKVFVGGVPEDTTEQDLKDYFGKFGEIDTVRIMKRDGKPRNFVFVVFKEEDGIERCLKDKKHVLNDKTVEVKRAIQVGMIVTRGVERRKVFIGGLQDHTSGDDIMEALAKVGFDKDEVQEVKIMTEKDTEKPRGFGFIIMQSNASAVRLVKMGNLGIKDTVANLDHAIPKEEGKKYREELERKRHDRHQDDYYDDRYYEGRRRSRYDSYDYYDDRAYEERYPGRYERYEPYPPTDYRRHPAPERHYYDDRPRMDPGYRAAPIDRRPLRGYYESDYGPTRHASYYDREMTHPYARR